MKTLSLTFAVLCSFAAAISILFIVFDTVSATVVLPWLTICIMNLVGAIINWKNWLDLQRMDEHEK